MTTDQPVGGVNDREAGASPANGAGSSPYATGGGGVSFAHRVAALYLTSMLTGSRRAEARELPVSRLAFQTGPLHPVDDLLVTCSDGQTEITVAIACRATPSFVQSDQTTVSLARSLLEEVSKFDTETHHLAVAAAGMSTQCAQLATLCTIARSQTDPQSFQASLETDGRWSKPVRDRWAQFLKIVAKAIDDPASPGEVLRSAWRLLSRLHVLGFAVQGADEADRTSAATSLDAVATNSVNGVLVRDRLEVEAARYDAIGAVVDRSVLQRDVHSLLDMPPTRSTQAEVARLGTRIEDLLKMLVAAEQASQGGEPWVRGEGVHTDPRFRTVTEQPAGRESHGAAAAEFRARLLVTPEYLPLTRGLVLDGVPFDAGAAGAPFTELNEALGDDRDWWLGLELNDHVPIGLQVVRAEILATVRGLEAVARKVSASSAAVVTAFDGWDLDSGPGEREANSSHPTLTVKEGQS